MYRKSDDAMAHDPEMATSRSKSEQTEFGARLEKAREEAGLTVDELARRVGMAQSSLTHAELKGSGSSKVASLARECKVSAYWLETGLGEKHPQQPTEPPPPIPSGPDLSPEALSLAEEFDEAPMGRSQRARVYRLCLAIILYGGLPPYVDLVAAQEAPAPDAASTARRARAQKTPLR